MYKFYDRENPNKIHKLNETQYNTLLHCVSEVKNGERNLYDSYSIYTSNGHFSSRPTVASLYALANRDVIVITSVACNGSLDFLPYLNWHEAVSAVGL